MKTTKLSSRSGRPIRRTVEYVIADDGTSTPIRTESWSLSQEHHSLDHTKVVVERFLDCGHSTDAGAASSPDPS